MCVHVYLVYSYACVFYNRSLHVITLKLNELKDEKKEKEISFIEKIRNARVHEKSGKEKKKLIEKGKKNVKNIDHSKQTSMS